MTFINFSIRRHVYLFGIRFKLEAKGKTVNSKSISFAVQ